MAKRYDEEDDDLDLDLEFDREEYMKKEMNKGKSTIIAVAIAPLFALVSMYVFNLTMEWVISLLAGLLGLIFLKPIYDRLDIDIDKIDKKGWAKNVAVYSLTLLAVWVILMNPPVSDFADPHVKDVKLEIKEADQGWMSPDEVEINETKTYEVRGIVEITDNVDVDDESVTIEVDGQETNVTKTDDNLYEFEMGDFEPNQPEGGEKSYDVFITVEDVNGNSNSVEKTLTIKW